MGDRVNIVVTRKGVAPIYFYGHWEGSRALPALHRALSKRWRWTDPAYLNRIIFCEFVRGNETEETGFGIDGAICDNGHPLIVVDHDSQEVYLADDNLLRKAGTPTFTFEQFVAIPAEQIGWSSFGVED